MSSPGSGKTTTLKGTIEQLKDRFRIGVMEADIDSDVDAKAIAETGVKSIQLHTGGMCHLHAVITRQGVERLGVADVDLAILAEADGVHVGQEDFPVPQVRALVGPDMLIGLSTHKPEQAEAARGLGADYMGGGPIYATHTKEDVVDPVGLEYLDWVSRNIDLPLVAIGGIKEHNIADVARHGARCCCLITDLVGAPDIPAKVAALRKAMQSGY